MEVVRLLVQVVLFFNLVQFHQIERENPRFFYWLLDFLVGGEIERGCNAHELSRLRASAAATFYDNLAGKTRLKNAAIASQLQ